MELKRIYTRKEAAQYLGISLATLDVAKNNGSISYIQYVTNVDAKEVHDISRTKDLLEKQVSSSVMWEQSIRNMIDGGVDTFVEIGPGKTLTGFLRKIDRNVAAYNVSSFEDVEVLKEKLLK